MMRMNPRSIALATACIMLAGCGGAGGPAAPVTPAKSASSAAASFVVKIPAKTTAPAGMKRPAYITSNVQAIDFTATSTTNSADSAYVFYPLTASSSYCTGSVATGLTCTLQVAAPPGSDTFTVNLYDDVAPYAGFIIATGSLTANIVAQQANTINITTNGVPTWAVVGSNNPYPATGAAASVPLSLQVVDPDGNIIVGSFDMPITISNSDSSGATVLSKTSLSQTSDANGLTLNYTGSGSAPATVTFSSTSPALAARTNSPTLATVMVQPGRIGPAVSPSMLYFTHANSAAQTITVSGENGSAGPFAVDAGCSPFVTVSGSGPTFTITPAQSTFSATSPSYYSNGPCQITVTDASSHSTTVGVMVGQ